MTYFVCLKSWFLFLLCSLFSSKNSFNFFGMVEGEAFNDFKRNVTGGRGQENTIFKRTSEMYDPLGISWYSATTSQINRVFLSTNETSQRRLKHVRLIDGPVAMLRRRLSMVRDISTCMRPI